MALGQYQLHNKCMGFQLDLVQGFAKVVKTLRDMFVVLICLISHANMQGVNLRTQHICLLRSLVWWFDIVPGQVQNEVHIHSILFADVAALCRFNQMNLDQWDASSR